MKLRMLRGLNISGHSRLLHFIIFIVNYTKLLLLSQKIKNASYTAIRFACLFVHFAVPFLCHFALNVVVILERVDDSRHHEMFCG